jgi:protein-S-isoprenylcysteine O-methyltransferase Ste14
MPCPTGRRNDGPKARGVASPRRRRLALKGIAALDARASRESAMAQSDRSIPLGGWLPPRMFLVSLALQVPGIALLWPPPPNVIELAAGGALIALGLALNLWADATFKRARVDVTPFGETPRLMEAGPFRYSRNPMYLGMAAASAGLAIASGALFNLVFAAGLAAWLERAYILPEERFLAKRFGAEYESYRRRAPRWLGAPTPTRGLTGRKDRGPRPCEE